MQLGEPGKVNSTINVTPLVDVVLVLLIIFMVMAPQMRKGPDVNVPRTTRPADQGDERTKVLVTIDQQGDLWIDDRPVDVPHLGEAVQAAVGDDPEMKVVIRADAGLHLGEVRKAMVAIEDAGFKGVGLIAKRAGGDKKGD